MFWSNLGEFLRQNTNQLLLYLKRFPFTAGGPPLLLVGRGNETGQFIHLRFDGPELFHLVEGRLQRLVVDSHELLYVGHVGVVAFGRPEDE